MFRNPEPGYGIEMRELLTEVFQWFGIAPVYNEGDERRR
jgi:hypothetical protein